MGQPTKASKENEREIKALKKEYKAVKKEKDVRGVLRAKALLAYYKGMPIETVADCYDVSAKSVKRWVKRFERTGKVKDGKREGRPKKLSQKEEAEVKEIISEQKERIWTGRHVCELIMSLFGVVFSVKYLPELLRRLGLSWQKAMHQLVQRDERKRRQWLEERLPELYEKQLKEGWRLFYQDEVGFQTEGTLSHSWGVRGEKIEVKNYGRQGRVNLIGALEVGTGLFHGILTRFSVNATRFRRYLCHLKREMPQDKLILICDNASFHHARWLKAWLAEQQDWLQLAFLPAYSPDFNPIERLWRWLKEEYVHNRCWPSQTALASHLQEMLAELPQRVAEYWGVLHREHCRWLTFSQILWRRRLAALCTFSTIDSQGRWQLLPPRPQPFFSSSPPLLPGSFSASLLTTSLYRKPVPPFLARVEHSHRLLPSAEGAEAGLSSLDCGLGGVATLA